MPLDQSETIAGLDQIAAFLRQSAELIIWFKTNHPDAEQLGYEPGQDAILDRMARSYERHARTLRHFEKELRAAERQRDNGS